MTTAIIPLFSLAQTSAQTSEDTLSVTSIILITVSGVLLLLFMIEMFNTLVLYRKMKSMS